MKEQDHEAIDALVERTPDNHDRALIRWLVASCVTADAALAAAEQRASESDARAERLAAACKIGLGVIVRSDLKGKEPREAIAALTTALTAPATQPDERAAAERALAKKTCEWIRYRNLVDASARSGLLMVTDEAARTEMRLEVEVQVLVERLAALDATDGAAKEETTG